MTTLNRSKLSPNQQLVYEEMLKKPNNQLKAHTNCRTMKAMARKGVLKLVDDSGIWQVVETKKSERVPLSKLNFYGVYPQEWNRANSGTASIFITDDDGNEYWVKRTRIIGCNWLAYDVCEHSGESCFSTKHSSICTPSGHHCSHLYTGTFDGWWGQIGTDKLPKEIDQLPRGEERINTYQKFSDERNQKAYTLIKKIFPEAVLGDERGSGQIDLFFE